MQQLLFDPAPTDPAPEPPATARARPAAAVERARTDMLVVDGNSVFHRAWHAYSRSALSAVDGTPTFGVYGFFALLAGIIDKTGAERVVVGFDSRRSERKARWPHYKATRSTPDPDLHVQMDRTIELCGELGVAVHIEDGWEADDVCGSVAALAQHHGWRCVIATSDRDSFALISDTTSVLRLGSGLDNATTMTPTRLVDDYGIRPEQYLAYAAMRGDSSDNLAGVPGIGAKTAAKLLNALDIDTAFDDLDAATAVLGAKTAAKLHAARSAYDENVAIMSIRRDLPVDVDAATFTPSPSHVADVFRAAGLPGLISRYTIIGASAGDDAPLPTGEHHSGDAAAPVGELAPLDSYEAPVDDYGDEPF
jgi:DNA polymerase-1